MRSFKNSTFGIGIILAFLLAQGCGKDACEDQAAEAQVDIQLSGIAPASISKTVVTIRINNDKVMTKTFHKAQPSFVFSLDYPEYNSAPYSFWVRAIAYSKANKELGYGEALNNFSFNGCNRFAVTIQPRIASDGGVDAQPDIAAPDRGQDRSLPDQARTDNTIIDQRVVDKSIVDQPMPDGEVPDLAMDMTPPPDQAATDSPIVDKTVIDMPVPDAPVPDMMQDFPVPDQMLPDLPPPPDSGITSTTKWVTVKAGSFKMGSPTTEPCREKGAGIKETLHTVVLPGAFVIGDQEVTQGEYQALMNANPSYFPTCGKDCPVERVTWHMAAAYSNALSKTEARPECYSCTGTGSATVCSPKSAYTGSKIYECLGYRLPTEAEWEFAYRAGTTTAFYNGAIDPASCSTSKVDSNAEKIGWYVGNSATKTHPARSKQPNAYGIYDMPGNVLEWTHDWFLADLGSAKVTDPIGAASGTEKTIKGGASPNGALTLRAAHRGKKIPTNESPWFGFRCVRSLPKWEALTSGTVRDLKGVWGVNDKFVFAVGKVGTILQYDGQIWTKHNLTTSGELTGVWGGNVLGPFYASEFGSSVWIWNGYGSKTWKQQPAGTSVYLTGISGISNSTSTWVWSVGSSTKVVHYNWPNWSHQALGGNTWLRCVYAKNTSGVWVGGDSAAIYAYNGVKWLNFSTGLPGTQIFYGIYSPNSTPQEVYAVGGNDSMITKYDGSSWKKVMGAGTMYAIHGIGSSDIFVVGPGGKILHYDGTNWSQQTSPTKEHLYGVWVAPSGAAFAVGDNGTIIRKQ